MDEIIMSIEISFKQLVDSTEPSFSEREKYLDYRNLCTVHSIPESYHYSRNKVEEYLCSKIGIILRSEQGQILLVEDIRKLPEQLLLQFFINNIDLTNYFQLSKIIVNAVKEFRGIALLEEKETWQKAIRLAKDVFNLSDSYTYETEQLDVFYKRLHAIGNSCKLLSQQGYTFKIETGSVLFESSEISRIAHDIETDIKTLGGIDVAQKLFDIIKSRYNIKQERYHLNPSFPPPNKSGHPEIPIAYLLNLCVKHFHQPMIITGTPETTFNRIIENSTAFASAVFDVQPYTQFENMFHNPKTIVELLVEVAIRDSLFNLFQLRVSDVTKILRKIFNCIHTQTQISTLGFEIEKIIKVIEKILDIVRSKHSPTEIHREQLILDLSYNSIIDTILDILSHPAPGPNVDFVLPNDISKNDFWFRPLLKINRERYLLMSPSWCSPSFYEAIATSLRSSIPQFNEIIGISIEELVKSELASKGVTFSSGEYYKKKGIVEGECDLIIETQNSIIFVEIKEKVLTRNAREGSDISILIDLGKSMINAQLQAGQHEIKIRKQGFLEIHKDQQMKRIELNGRNVERIALSFLDFGGFQDRTVINDLLRIASLYTFASDHTECSDRINEINRKARKLNKQFEELKQLNTASGNNFFINCWFLSVPQLLIVLDDVKSNETFQQALFKTRHLSYKTLDFYFEYFQASNIIEK